MFAINSKVSNIKVSGRCQKVSKDGLINQNDKNYPQIVCRRCSSLFFPEDSVVYVENNPVDLRVMMNQGVEPLETERISWWWYTSDEMDFDTIGWQTIDRKKVLMCAECDLGPVGYRTEDNSKFYVAVERVAYKSVESLENDEDEEEEKRPVVQKREKRPVLRKPIPKPPTKRPASKTKPSPSKSS